MAVGDSVLCVDVDPAPYSLPSEFAQYLDYSLVCDVYDFPPRLIPWNDTRHQ